MKRFLVTPIILLVAMVINIREHLSTDVLDNPPGSHSTNFQPEGGRHLPALLLLLRNRARPGGARSSRGSDVPRKKRYFFWGHSRHPLGSPRN